MSIPIKKHPNIKNMIKIDISKRVILIIDTIMSSQIIRSIENDHSL